MKKNVAKKRFAFPVKDADFKTSTFTNPGGIINRCVKVAITDKGVALRDSKNNGKKRQTTLFFNFEEWQAFLKGAKRKEFDV